MKKLIVIVMMIYASAANGQDTLKFLSCLEAVKENAPRLHDNELIDQQGQLKIENVQRAWYPQLTMNGKATYQSDVVSLSIDQPGFTLDFPEMPNEQFALNLDVSQTIYDGGVSKRKRTWEQVSTEVALQQVKVDLHTLKQQAAEIYLSALFLQENRKNLSIALENLEAREQVVVSAVENGITEAAELSQIRVEIMKTLQSLSELDAAREGALNVLEVFMGKQMQSPVIIANPSLAVNESDSMLRPELKYLQLQSDLLEAGKEMQSAKRMPKFYAFGQAGVGMPGYNMLNDKVDSYYMVGAGMQWNIWDWNTVSREKQILTRQQQVLEHSKESFQMQIQAGLEKEMAQIRHFKSSIEMDDKMLQMRMEITANAASKLDHGVISATDYLQVMNEEHLTRVRRTTHQVQLLRSIVNYQLLNGTI